jgi:hypothetical protein
VMKRKLSSFETLLSKWIVPLVFGGMSVFLLVQLILQWREIKDLSQVLFPLLWVTGAWIGCWYSFLLKNVSVDDSFLYVRNYFKEVIIPFTNVESITYFGLGNITQVTIHLKLPSAFGNKIRFAPPYHTFFGIVEPPVVAELRELVRMSNERSTVSTTQPPNKSLKPSGIS